MDLFGTAGIRGNVVERTTPELALAVGRAAGATGDGFVVGRDGRETGAGLAAAVEAGLLSGGATVYRAGMLPTPALAFASQGRRGIMLTASHNPPTDNGLKLFVDGVEYDRDGERAIEDGVEAGSPPVSWNRWGDREDTSPLPAYRDAVADYVRERSADLAASDDRLEKPLAGLRVVVDCGNGMGALATPQVLRTLGAAVVTLNANVDGHFPGRESKPTPETLTDLRGFLRDADGAFDLGVAHDGDADRIVVVAPDGDVVHEDTIVAILAEHYVRAAADDDADSAAESDPVVVTTPNASARIDERVRAAGGRVERVRLGSLHEGIASARADGGDVVFAAEPWKHIHTSFGGWIDGVTSAAMLGSLVAATGLDGLREAITERPYRKTSVTCPDDAKVAAMTDLETELPEAFPDAEADTDYGVRLEFPDASWVLVRPSGTEPYVRIYVESDDVDELLGQARSVVDAAVEHATESS